MSGIVTKLLAVMQKVAGAIVPGSPAAIEAVQSVINLVEHIKSTLTEADQLKLQEAMPNLLAAMNAAVDQAVEDLGGSQV